MLGEPISEGTMGDQVAPVMAVRKTSPRTWESSLQEKRLYFMLVFANTGATLSLFESNVFT